MTPSRACLLDPMRDARYSREVEISAPLAAREGIE